MEETKKTGLGTAGLVLGIIGICTSIIPIINNLSFIMGILAVIFGIIALVKHDSKGKTIATIILGILAIVITLNAQKATLDALDEAMNTFSDNMNTITGGNTEEVLANGVDVSIGDFQVEKKQYGITDTKLPVKITNKTSETKSFSIQIEAVNPDGSRINTDTIYASNLTAGQSQEFNAFNFVSSEDLEAMQNATFNVVEASMY